MNVAVGEGSEDSITTETLSEHLPELVSEEVLEPWRDFIKRATHSVEDHCRKVGIKDWVSKQRLIKWCWAGRVTRCEDNRWLHCVLTWQPTGQGRLQRRLKTRWTDELQSFVNYKLGSNDLPWYLLASSCDEWVALEEEFAEYAHSSR